MKVSFAPEARIEFLEAVALLDDRRAGLGREFAKEINGAIRKIVEHPLR